ncbi:MAG: hypothetical protein AAB250_06070, partial [Bdellovibrionota bacterium]
MRNFTRISLVTACLLFGVLTGCVEASHFNDGSLSQLLNGANCSGISTVSTANYCAYAGQLRRANLFGAGTSSDPYEICSPYQLNSLATDASYMNAYFKQTADLDMSCIASNHVPVGSSSVPFTGTYDGNSKTIRNWKYVSSASDDVGVFAYVRAANIHDLTIESATVTGKDYVGIAFGRAEASHLLQIATAGTVTGVNYVGGVAGRAELGAVNQSRSSAKVVGTSDVGGVVGNGDTPIVISSYFTGSVTASGTRAGGVIGNANYGYVINSYSTGAVTSTAAQVGGVVGVTSGLVRNAYSTGAISGTTS